MKVLRSIHIMEFGFVLLILELWLSQGCAKRINTSHRPQHLEDKRGVQHYQRRQPVASRRQPQWAVPKYRVTSVNPYLNIGRRRTAYPWRPPQPTRYKYGRPVHPRYSNRYRQNAPYQRWPLVGGATPRGPGYVPAFRTGPSQDKSGLYQARPWSFRTSYPHRGGTDSPRIVLDSWGPWGEWSSCSRTCDGGVRTRRRTCQQRGKLAELSLHRGGGSAAKKGNCPGSPHDYQPCSTKLCTSQKSFKDQKYEARMIQCAEYNDKNYLGKKYTWVPYIRTGLNECRLYCMAKGHRMFVELAEKVKEGTPCGGDGTQACYDGACSKLRPNKHTGVPAKSVTSQRFIHRNLPKPKSEPKFIKKSFFGTFNTTSSLKLGYNTIFKVPVGATDVYITEGRPSRNYIALKVGGRYIVNGGWQIDVSRDIRAAGTIIRYKITPGQYSVESFRSKGPVLQEIEVQLLYQEEAPFILYNYTMKLPDTVDKVVKDPPAHAPSLRVAAQNAGTNSQYQWRIQSMTPCSAPCGGGEQEFVYRCSSQQRDGTPVFVEDYYCGYTAPPRGKRVCNMRPCPSRWVTLPWKPCTKTCGRGGVQLRDIRCRKVTKRNGQDAEINVPINQCDIRSRPAIQRVCPYRSCHRIWKTSEWSECSKSCDKGTQERQVKCVTEDGFQLPPNACNQQPKPPTRRNCVKRPCTSHWFTSRWSECSAPCGEGVKRRIVYCAGVGGSAVPSAHCDGKFKPSETQKCQFGNCSGVWLTSNWTKCSSVCGPGVQSRVVICVAIRDGKFQEVDSKECSISSRPAQKQKCSGGPCSGTMWFMTDWAECSVRCGKGLQHRKVTCLTSDGHLGRGCQLEKKPFEVRQCFGRRCSERKTSTAELSSYESRGGKFVVISQTKTETPSEGRTRSKTEERADHNDGNKSEKGEHRNDFRHEKKVIGSAFESRSHQTREKESLRENSSRRRDAVRSKIQKSKDAETRNYVDSESIAVPSGTSRQSLRHSTRATTTTASTATPTTMMTTVKLKQKTTSTEAPKRTTHATKRPAKVQIVKRPNATTLVNFLKSKNISCKDEKSASYCRVIIRLQFCKFTVYKKRCCSTCSQRKS